ncbi:phage tail protein [Bacillus solitudinis]|uniref:phage tail protein n=1 Tax=Bacillus solitudinis TaxID=2014074 RepID=UPI000C2461CB|nr:tail fiber protein [Bacillus solitudinis]
MSDQFIGEIRQFAGNYAPVDWAFCDGKVLSISENEALFSLIGTTYGGDGQTTFALPDFRGRIVLNQGSNPTTGTAYNQGQKSGTETVTLTEQQLPNHTHGVAASSTAGTEPSPANALWAKAGYNQYSNQQPNQTMNVAVVSSTGGSQSHENMMPYLTVSYIIALTGYYPTRN